ncbi:MAG: hypothetical protein HY350_03890, partial [Candidatus Omnitrophica bacterium]|nr:hypothetical protein [Candidatus Omnitrophota bacterium]
PKRIRLEDVTLNGLFGTGRGWAGAVFADSSLNIFLDMDTINLLEVSRNFYPDRIEAEGALRGWFWLKMKNGKLELLNGDFNTLTSGKIKVKSTGDLLSGMPEAVNREILAMALDSMKDYMYESGRIKLTNEGADVAALFNFEGIQGKREFEFHWHPRSQ